MDLQNIVIDFLEGSFSTLYQDNETSLDSIESLAQIKEDFQSAYNIQFDRIIVQLSSDQHYSEPRILCMLDGETTIINMSEIVMEHPEIYTTLRAIRLNIEDELQYKLDNPIIL
jgi:hypothetical protein